MSVVPIEQNVTRVRDIIDRAREVYLLNDVTALEAVDKASEGTDLYELLAVDYLGVETAFRAGVCSLIHHERSLERAPGVDGGLGEIEHERGNPRRAPGRTGHVRQNKDFWHMEYVAGSNKVLADLTVEDLTLLIDSYQSRARGLQDKAKWFRLARTTLENIAPSGVLGDLPAEEKSRLRGAYR